MNLKAPRLSGSHDQPTYSDTIDDGSSRSSGIYIPQRKTAADIKVEIDDMETRCVNRYMHTSAF